MFTNLCVCNLFHFYLCAAMHSTKLAMPDVPLGMSYVAGWLLSVI